MSFQFLPLITTMIAYYRQPIGQERFQNYLQLLHGGTKDEVILPISGYNPMAKVHVLNQLIDLQNIGAEDIMKEAIETISIPLNTLIKLFFELADDLKGGWTNRYTTDYNNRFRNTALLERGFSPVTFWTSEVITPELITDRTRQQIYRTVYRCNNPDAQTLEEHIVQEQQVFTACNKPLPQVKDLPQYENYRLSTSQPVILNFLYGDDAAQSLGYAPLGMCGIL